MASPDLRVIWVDYEPLLKILNKVPPQLLDIPWLLSALGIWGCSPSSHPG